MADLLAYNDSYLAWFTRVTIASTVNYIYLQKLATDFQIYSEVDFVCNYDIIKCIVLYVELTSEHILVYTAWGAR